MSPFLTDKGTKRKSKNLIEETRIIIDDTEVAKNLTTYFSHEISSLGIIEPMNFITDHIDLNLFAIYLCISFLISPVS